MTLAFVDADENQGRIRDDFAVDYDGPEEVEGYVRGMVRSAATDEQAVEAIIIEMVHDLDVKEVRRASAEDPVPAD